MSEPPQASEKETVSAALRAVHDGDPDAFADVVELYQRRLFGLMLMMTRDRMTAEDVMQEAFIRAYLNIERFDQGREFYPWLATIAVRLAQNLLRRRAETRSREVETLEAPDSETAPDALGELIEDERSRRLWRVVASLPKGERTAVFLHYREDMRVADVAAVLGATVGTVKTMLFRARDKIRRLTAEIERPETEIRCSDDV